MSDIDILRRGVGAGAIWKGIRSNDMDFVTDLMYNMEADDLLYTYSSLRSELFNRSNVPHLDDLSKNLLARYATFLEDCYKDVTRLRTTLSETSSLPDNYQTYQTQSVALGIDPLTYHEWVDERSNLSVISAVKES